MQTDEILDLYFARDERASEETSRQFGSLIYTVAFNILGSAPDAEEIVNDTLIRLWGQIPPARPAKLGAYIAATARNLARNRYAAEHTLRRGGSNAAVALDELRDACSAPDTVEQETDRRALSELLNRFLGTLKPLHRKIFVQRYWYFSTVAEIAQDLHISESRVTVTLTRTRRKLAEFLRKEWET